MTEVSDSLVQDTNHVLYPFSCDTNIQVQVQTTLNLASLCMFKAAPRFVVWPETLLTFTLQGETSF